LVDVLDEHFSIELEVGDFVSLPVDMFDGSR
jgi:hypothetical protein